MLRMLAKIHELFFPVATFAGWAMGLVLTHLVGRIYRMP